MAVCFFKDAEEYLLLHEPGIKMKLFPSLFVLRKI